jgi:hypothetical protein
MKQKIKKLFANCFRHLGVKAAYCNQNREVICEMKALVKHPDMTYSIGSDGALTSQIASIEIRSRDVSNPTKEIILKLVINSIKLFSYH